MFVDEDLGRDDCPEWLECCDEVCVSELLGQVVDEQVVGPLSPRPRHLLHAAAVRSLDLPA